MRKVTFWDVAIALPLIMIGLGVAATGIFMFVGVPMVMIGVGILAGSS